MNKAEFNRHVESGARLLALAEFRSGVAETIDYRDKTTGRAMQFKKATYNIEVGPLAIQITERLDEKVSTPEWKAPFKKGETCVWHIEGLERDRSGLYKGQGKLEDYKA